LFADDCCKPVLSFSVPSDLVGGTLSASLLCLFVYCLSLHNNWDGVRKRIEQRTDIAPRTLARWISGETEEPDRKRLFGLLAALPQQQG
jgi:transcriptional regulator with XRE-family HTH domain